MVELTRSRRAALGAVSGPPGRLSLYGVTLVAGVQKSPVQLDGMSTALPPAISRPLVVAGTHGKTTTTSMVAAVLDAGGFAPTVLIGGEVNDLGANARQIQLNKVWMS